MSGLTNTSITYKLSCINAGKVIMYSMRRPTDVRQKLDSLLCRKLADEGHYYTKFLPGFRNSLRDISGFAEVEDLKEQMRLSRTTLSDIEQCDSWAEAVGIVADKDTAWKNRVKRNLTGDLGKAA